jgi:hypothetical protein
MVASRGAVVALPHHPVIACGASNYGCILGVHDVESQYEIISDIGDKHKISVGSPGVAALYLTLLSFGDDMDGFFTH